MTPTKATVSRHSAQTDTLVGMLEHALEHAPDDLGYRFLANGKRVEATLSYRRLAHSASAIGAWLRRHTTPGSPVLLLYPPGLDFLSAFFGCLCASTIAVPVYPPDPTRLGRTLPRLQTIAADAGATVVLTTSAVESMFRFVLDQAPDLAAMTWLCTDQAPDQDTDHWQPPQISADTPAFLQYTSGSTSAPRGVVIRHGNLTANLALMHRVFDNGPDSHAVNWLPLYHDMGLIGAILQPLYALHPGSFMSPLTFLSNPVSWLEAISTLGGTHCGGPNFGYHLCVGRVSQEALESLDLSSWRLAFNGAEPIRADTMARFAKRFAPCGFRPEAFFPCYGLAEATLYVSGGPIEAAPRHLRLDPQAAAQRRVVLVDDDAPGLTVVSSGDLHPEMAVKLVHDGQPCAADQVGEIWTRGKSVSSGYWGQERLSGRTFGAELEGHGDGWLCTGDLGFVHDGQLYVMGRLKDMIIVRGRNHYPQDLELAAEQAHKAVRTGCVAAFGLEINGAEELGIVAEVRRGADPQEVIGALRRALVQEHDIKPLVVALVKPRSIPKTSSGKIQRRASRQAWLEGTLELVEARTFASEAQTNAPLALPTAAELGALGDLERAASLQAALVAQIAHRTGLNDAEINPKTPINQHGLDSLAAAELQHELARHLEAEIALGDLLGGASVEALTALLLDRMGRQTPVAPLKARQSGDLAPLSYQQERSWWFDRVLERGTFRFHVSGAYRLEGDLNKTAMNAALGDLVERHEALRIRFEVDSEGQPRQRILPDLDWTPSWEDISDLQGTKQEAALHQLASRQAAEVFDLERDPLLRVSLVRLGAKNHTLLLTLHHIIADAASVGRFVHDLAALYQAKIEGKEADLLPIAIQFPDYAAWQRQTLQGPGLEGDLEHWRTHLEGHRVDLQLTDPGQDDAVSAHKELVLPAEVVAELQKLSRTHGVTLFMTLMATYQLALRRWTGAEDLLVDSVFSSRTDPQLEPVIGFIAENMVLRADLSGAPTFSELLGRVRTQVLDVYQRRAWRSLFFTDPNLRQIALSPICLNMQPPLFLNEELRRGGLRWQPQVALTQELMVHCLGAILYIFQRDGGRTLHFDLVHNKARFDDAWAKDFLGYLGQTLRAVASEPDTSVEALLG